MRMEQKIKIKRGYLLIKKKSLVDHCAVLSRVLNEMDIVMKEKESFERGKKIAKLMNALTFSNHTIQHFELNVSLKKLK